MSEHKNSNFEVQTITEAIKIAFANVSKEWKAILVTKLRAELKSVIEALHGGRVEKFCPEPRWIFGAFLYCQPGQVKVVVVGQDPYLSKREAMGLSFSVPRGVAIPPSLLNIYKCLLGRGQISEIPKHGDLTSWCEQGVLMINSALTTIEGASNMHAAIWQKYTDEIISYFGALDIAPCAFLLLGTFAKKKANLIAGGRHGIFTWGHPSPLNGANKKDCPENFRNCDSFERANEFLAKHNLGEINWNSVNGLPPVGKLNSETSCDTSGDTSTDTSTDTSGEINNQLEIPSLTLPAVVIPIVELKVVDDQVDELRTESTQGVIELTNEMAKLPTHYGERERTYEPALDNDRYYLFTDGGAEGNGKKNCKSSWGYYLTDGRKIYFGADLMLKSTNNKGELTALLMGLQKCRDLGLRNVAVYSDSEYSINCVTKWYHGWVAKGELEGKANLDLIAPIVDLAEDVGADFHHVRSHQEPPRANDAEFAEKAFLWRCNDIVDQLCNLALGRRAEVDFAALSGDNCETVTPPPVEVKKGRKKTAVGAKPASAKRGGKK